MQPLRIGIVAGEASSDLLAAGLIGAIREREPRAQFEGIAGPRMRDLGVRALWPAEKLAVWGLAEMLGHLPEILRIRRRLAAHFIQQPPDVFVGVDAPDFNIPLEGRLRAAAIPTSHFVSPSVWAWRRYRIHRIKRSVDLMLTLFPFEAAFYEAHHMPVRFVGHPLADQLSGAVDRDRTRAELGLGAAEPVLALLPGSRHSELRFLAPDFVRAAALCRRAQPALRCIAPMTGPDLRAQFEQVLRERDPTLPVEVVDGGSHTVMAAADVVLLAAGTAALEAMLLRRPMVVAYRVARLTKWIFRWTPIARMPYFSLPNLLAGKAIVPEYMQEAATPENLARAVLDLFEDQAHAATMVAEFERLHTALRCDASHRAAEAILDLARSRGAGA